MIRDTEPKAPSFLQGWLKPWSRKRRTQNPPTLGSHTGSEVTVWHSGAVELWGVVCGVSLKKPILAVPPFPAGNTVAHSAKLWAEGSSGGAHYHSRDGFQGQSINSVLGYLLGCAPEVMGVFWTIPGNDKGKPEDSGSESKVEGMSWRI